MSDFPTDETLKRAFQALGPSSTGHCPDEELDRIWLAVSGELPPDERRALVDRLATNPACAEAWRIADELWRASAAGGIRSVQPRRRAWSPSWLAAAAVVLLGVGAALAVRYYPSEGDEFRDTGRPVVESLVGPETTLSRDAFRLRWTPGPPGSRYTVRVTTGDLRVLATVVDLETPELVLPADRLATVAPGERVLWQVDLALPGGETVSSQTFVTRVN